MGSSDFAPTWLNKTFHPVDPMTIEIEVDVDSAGLNDASATHQTAKTTERRWTPAMLKRKKASLLRQLEKERKLQADTAGLREECIELSVELQALKSRRTSHRVP